VWGAIEMHARFWVGKPEETDHWEDIGVEGNAIKKNICSRCGVQERCIQYFGSETLRERDRWVDIGVEGNKILKWIFVI
jgi:hypothetical protein